MVDVKPIPEFGRFTSACGLENRVIAANMPCLPVDSDLDGEAFILCMHMNAIDSGLIPSMSALVFTVFGLTNIPQITNSVVSGITVYMVNGLCWMTAVVVKPCEAMSLPNTAKYANPNVAPSLRCRAHDLASLPPCEFCSKLIASRVFKARENASFWIVMNVFFKLFLSDHIDTLVKAVGRMRQPLTRWGSGCIPSRTLSLTI